MKYLKNISWAETTREERYFCAELFFEIRNNQLPFLTLINRDIKNNYEVGYEVCFYRDILKAHGLGIRNTQFPSKRTFDLVLFSEYEIIIIEAKANQGFDSIQLSYFEADIHHITKLFKNLTLPLPSITFIAIYSSLYTPSLSSIDRFTHHITWQSLCSCYPNSSSVFLRADDIYAQ